MGASGLPLEALQHKASLVQQLRTLQANHDALLAAIERRLDAEMVQAGGPGPQAHIAAGSKRPAPSALVSGPDAKRQRLLGDREARTKEIWADISRILDRMRKNTKAGPFLHPVDPIKLKIPDYFKIITKPMDLGTVKKKLSAKAYSSPLEVAEDVRQVFINCATYNPKDYPIAKMGVALSEIFERSWLQFDIDNRWALECKRCEREDQVLAGELGDAMDDDMPQRMRDMRQMLGDYIAASDQLAGLAPGVERAAEPSRPMSFEEKRKLSAHLAGLPAEKLLRVMEILQESTTAMDIDTEDEVELELDQLPDATLWALREYVDSVAAGPPPKKTPGGTNRAAPDKRAPGVGGAAAAANGTAAPPKHHAPGAMRPPPPRPPQQQQQEQQQNEAANEGSPPHSGEGHNSPQDVVASSGRGATGVTGTRGIVGLGDAGTVAQSGNNLASSSAFIKPQRTSGDVTREVDMAAWANVGAAAPDDAAANGDGPEEAKAAEDAEGDEVWADFAAKAAQEEERKKQAAEEEAKRKEAEARRKQEEEEQKRQLEELERQKELEAQAAKEAEEQRQQQELADLQAKAHLASTMDMLDEVNRLQKGASGADGHGAAAEEVQEAPPLTEFAVVDEDDEGGYEEDI